MLGLREAAWLTPQSKTLVRDSLEITHVLEEHTIVYSVLALEPNKEKVAGLCPLIDS